MSYIFTIPFMITYILMPLFINFLNKKMYFQQINVETPDNHKLKNKTPAMGGCIVLAALILISIAIPNITNYFLVMTAILFSVIGIIDDWQKLVYKKLGISAKTKLQYQFIVTIIILFIGYDLNIIKNIVLIPGLGKYDIGIFAIPLYIFAIIGSSNAVNLTDGLDGLAANISIITLSSFAYLTYNNNIEIYYFCCYTISALIGFFIYNKHPAKIFMGDSGSLMLGGLIAVIAISSGYILLLPIIGGVFVIETLSVIIQVYWFQRYKKKFFLMTPLHHHFEIKGWHETNITIIFSISSILLSITGVFIGNI